jgi:hypothetical protein
MHCGARSTWGPPNFGVSADSLSGCDHALDPVFDRHLSCETIAETVGILRNQTGNLAMLVLDLVTKGEGNMTFIYDKGMRSAVNRDKGITISASQKFTDSYPVMLFEYIENERKFEFYVVIRSENRRCIFRNKEVEMNLPLSVTIGELSLCRGAHGFLRKEPRGTEEYDNIRENIRDGMMCLVTYGGEIKDLTPDLVVSIGEIKLK